MAAVLAVVGVVLLVTPTQAANFGAHAGLANDL